MLVNIPRVTHVRGLVSYFGATFRGRRRRAGNSVHPHTKGLARTVLGDVPDRPGRKEDPISLLDIERPRTHCDLISGTVKIECHDLRETSLGETSETVSSLPLPPCLLCRKGSHSSSRTLNPPWVRVGTDSHPRRGLPCPPHYRPVVDHYGTFPTTTVDTGQFPVENHGRTPTHCPCPRRTRRLSQLSRVNYGSGPQNTLVDCT